MAITIRLASIDDAPTIGELIHAMDVHYRSSSEVQSASAAAAMARRTLECREGTFFFLAYDAEAAVGIACCAIMRPGSSLSGVLYLKDLFTIESARNRGVGRALLATLAQYCFDHGIGRIDFSTEASNTGAQRLYDRLGGVRQSKVMYRFDGDRLRQLAEPSRIERN